MKDKKKSNVWFYGIILFTSAFIVLLFAGFSQIRMNRSLDDYKSQVFNTESEKNKYLQNFSSAQEMNEKLNEEIKTLEEENSELLSENYALKSEKAALEAAISKKKTASDGLANVINAYIGGEVAEAASLLKNVDSNYLEDKSFEIFSILDTKIKLEAGKLLYDEGYSLYKRAKYAEASEKLLLSSQYAPAETFSDKCLYYLSYAQVKIGDTVAALEHMTSLIDRFPESRYLKSAKQFISKYGLEEPNN